MKDFVTDNITTGSGAYMFKFGFRHLLSSISENDNNIIKSLLDGIDTVNKVIILHGCQIDGSDPSLRNYTAGAVYYNGEIYPVDASTVTTVGTEVPFWKIDTVTTNSLFTDDVPKGWLVTRKMKLVSASVVSGVNLQRYDLTRRIEHVRFNKSHEKNHKIELLGLPTPTFIADNFDTNGLGKVCTKWEGFGLAVGGVNGTVDMAGATTIGYNFKGTAVSDVRGIGDYLVETIGTLVGKWKHQLTIGEMPSHNHNTDKPTEVTTSDGFGSETFSTGAEAPEGASTFTMNNVGGNQAHPNIQPSVIAIVIQKVAEPVV